MIGNDNFGGHLAGQGENFRWAHAIGHKLSIALNEANAIAVDELRDEACADMCANMRLDMHLCRHLPGPLY